MIFIKFLVDISVEFILCRIMSTSDVNDES